MTRSRPLARRSVRPWRRNWTSSASTLDRSRSGTRRTAAYRLERDPACGEHSLIGEWRDFQGQKLGGLVFHEDGSFFVEYDVIRTHPRDDRWFVEAVNAWGRGTDIRAEPRLLPLPE